MMKKKFGEPDPNYIPGLYRGAVGFFTRSDIGPARNLGGNDNLQSQPASRQPKQNENEDNDLADYSETKFDKWNGYEGSLFSNTEYNDEDRDADIQYSEVDRYMDGRRKSRREKKLKETIEKFRNERPTIAQQFSDLRKDLSSLSREDWESIPEINDYTIKKKKQERYTPVPDRIIEQGRNDGETVKSIDTNEGTTSSFGNLNEVGKAKNSILSLVFDKIGDNVSGIKSVNPIGYITELDSQKINTPSDISDFKKARLLLKSVITTNPKEVSGWIAAARLEELDGKVQQARNIIAQATQHILDSESIWLEAARLHPPEQSKIILAKAIAHIPESEKLWLGAASKENDKITKSKILRRALEHLPTSIQIWKAAIDIEKESEAKALLKKAVECVPKEISFWLALAKLETYESARETLNKAINENPNSHEIWLHVAILEESAGKSQEEINKLVNRMIKTLSRSIRKEDWIKEAEICERAGHLKTLSAIIKGTIHLEMEKLSEREKKKIWLDLAEGSIQRGCLECARFIYENALVYLPKKKSIWIKAIELEKTYGRDKVLLEKILLKAVNTCPEKEIFWLIYAKHIWQNSSDEVAGINQAKAIILDAQKHHPDSEEIILALVKLERESNQYDNARIVLNNAREICEEPRVWMQSIQLERETDNLKKALELCEKALEKEDFKKFYKFWLILAQIKDKLGINYEEIVSDYSKAIEINPDNSLLYVSLAKLYLINSEDTKARSIFEKARGLFPNDSNVWIESIRMEIVCDNLRGANLLLSKGLQECPKNGQLWVLAIELEPKHQKKAKALDALNNCEHDAYVMIEIAKIFYEEKMIEKARKWFEKATKINPDLGDAWAYYLRIEMEHPREKKGNDKDRIEEIIEKCVANAPRYGELWISVSKDVQNWKMKKKDVLFEVAKMVNL